MVTPYVQVFLTTKYNRVMWFFERIVGVHIGLPGYSLIKKELLLNGKLNNDLQLLSYTIFIHMEQLSLI